MILVTGGLGYIGPQLVKVLIEDSFFEGEDIVIFDNLRGRFDYEESPSKPLSIFDRLRGESDRVKLEVGDIRYDTKRIQELVSDSEYVFHLAAVTGAQYSENEKTLYWETIFNGTANVLSAVEKSKNLKRLVNISSCNIYGQGGDGDTLDESDEIVPINTYAKAIYAAEALSTRLAKENSLPIVSLRMSTNFGNEVPSLGGTRNNLVVNKFVWNALHGEPVTPYGDGMNWRPFIHVFDAATLIKEIAKIDEGLVGDVFNAGFNDMNFRVKEVTQAVVETVRERTGKETKVKYMREKYRGPSYNVNFDKIEDLLGLKKTYDLKDGINLLIDYYMG